MKPTVGRIVMYDDGGPTPKAAIVSHVWSDTCVNLHIMDANPSAPVRLETSRLYNEVPGSVGTWRWPERS